VAKLIAIVGQVEWDSVSRVGGAVGQWEGHIRSKEVLVGLSGGVRGRVGVRGVHVTCRSS